MQKSMLISAGIMTLIVLEVLGLVGVYPCEWLNFLAWLIFVSFVLLFLAIILGLMVYDYLYDD
ncbi:MAG: hypothetical protein V8T39_06480 [Streptococcus lutetiensis]